MKNPLKNACVAIVLLGLTSCSYVGLVTKSQLRKQVSAAQQRGIQQGRADEIRKNYHRKQAERALPPPEPEKTWYAVPVAAHRNSEGVIVDAHTLPIQVVKP